MAEYTVPPLPYDYALNLTPGTPLYRRLPLRRERRENEKDLAIGRGAKNFMTRAEYPQIV